MTISDLKKQFQEDISELYTASESLMLCYIFAEKEFGFNKHQLRKLDQQEILTQDEDHFITIISELKSGKPYQQIVGEAEFYGKTFFVNEHVLIPRPETEELLELAQHYIKEYISKTDKTIKILDIGTGSGVIPIILKSIFPTAEITSIDISGKAIEVAKKNAEHHKVNIAFIQQDYLQSSLSGTYDIIISNPPYIGQNEEIDIEHSVKSYEPNIALFSPTSDALIFYRKIAKDAELHLKKEGLIFLEINQLLGLETLEFYMKFSESRLIKDISDNDRMIFVKK